MTTIYRLVCDLGHRWREAHAVGTLRQFLRTSGTQAVQIRGHGLPTLVSCPYCGLAAVDVARVDEPSQLTA